MINRDFLLLPAGTIVWQNIGNTTVLAQVHGDPVDMNNATNGAAALGRLVKYYREGVPGTTFFVCQAENWNVESGYSYEGQFLYYNESTGIRLPWKTFSDMEDYDFDFACATVMYDGKLVYFCNQDTSSVVNDIVDAYYDEISPFETQAQIKSLSPFEIKHWLSSNPNSSITNLPVFDWIYFY